MLSPHPTPPWAYHRLYPSTITEEDIMIHRRFYSAIVLWLLSYERTMGDVAAMFDVPEGRLEALRKNAYMFAGG
jgi:hypothetical protein